MSTMRTLLLNPGPVTLSDRVRQALLQPDLCHREPEFATLQHGIRDKLLRVHDLDPSLWAAVLLTGSGTAAVEAMIASMILADGHVLVVDNGVYGDRMQRIAASYGIKVTTVTSAWGQPMDIDAVAAQLDANREITHVAAVHHETTTGRLNDIQSLATVCRETGVKLLLDAVSSFAAESIDFANWPLSACAATANKCLHGIPGAAFVVCRRDQLPELPQPRSVYLDLRTYLRSQDAGGTPFTQSVHSFYALDAALDEFFELGGRAARERTYRERILPVRGTLVSAGVQPLLADADCSCVLHAFRLPEGTSYADLHDRLKAAGFVIYAGQGAYADSIFRISMMGDITAADVDRLCRELGNALVS